ncbi:MAG TPA: RNA-binding S4 domain-containing protein [Anaerolineae bacterium]
MKERTLSQSGEFIKLDQFLKWQGLVDTGGQAKQLIQSGAVRVNGQIETRRGRKLINGDHVTIGNRTFLVKVNV